MLGKLRRANHTLYGHFVPAYLVESNQLRAYLFFIYGSYTQDSITKWSPGNQQFTFFCQLDGAVALKDVDVLGWDALFEEVAGGATSNMAQLLVT